MKIFFAMDLIEGQAVRLVRGDFDQKKVYSDDPLSKIVEMTRAGARDFHIIDLDGARTGKGVHQELIREIRGRVEGYMEVGGGIRTEEEIDYYTRHGVNGIILGTRALTDRAFLGRMSARKNIVLGLDMKDGRVMTAGWTETACAPAEELLGTALAAGVMAVLFTSIGRDGTLEGPDFEGLKRLQSLTALPLIASGGVSSVDDVKRLKEMNVWAAIVGKAYYEGLIPIEEVMKYAD
jgi:phosphoribosylformimino-5-aminoimidazole carboxamide ribotide isomerase